jgi:hypothetical protein
MEGSDVEVCSIAVSCGCPRRCPWSTSSYSSLRGRFPVLSAGSDSPRGAWPVCMGFLISSYTEATERCPMNVSGDDTQRFPLSAYSCIPIQLPPPPNVMSNSQNAWRYRRCHVDITTNVLVDTMVGCLEEDTGKYAEGGKWERWKKMWMVSTCRTLLVGLSTI